MVCTCCLCALSLLWQTWLGQIAGSGRDRLPLANVSEQKNTEVNDVPEQLRIRREKRDRLLESGVEAYPVSVERTIALKELRHDFRVVAEGEEPGTEEGVTYLAPGEETEVTHAIAGRLIFMRNTGKLCFATLQDGDGTQVQASFP